MSDTSFDLPPVVLALVKARNRVQDHYAEVLRNQGSDAQLRFTLDGNLVGDIGEALAVELFGVELVKDKAKRGVDGNARDGRSVQVKATGRGLGPAFRYIRATADHLLFFDLDLEGGKGQVIFNGPECFARKKLPKKPMNFKGQHTLTKGQIREAALEIAPEQQLERIDR